MTVPAYTPVQTTRPRLLCRTSDKTALAARTNDSSGWQSLWDGAITSRANSLKGMADDVVCNNAAADNRLMVLAFYGWIEETGRPSNGYKAKAISAAMYMAGLSDSLQPSDKRARIWALTLVFDFLYDDMTTNERNTLAAEILQQCDRMLRDAADMIDGHSGIDQVFRIGAALTLLGHGTADAAAQVELQEALQFWYGTLPGEGRIEFTRYHYDDGGSDKGSWYTTQAFWGELLLMQFMTKATSHNAWSNESSHLSKVWEYLLWSQFRGGVDDDFEEYGDTAKLNGSTRMHILQRWTYGLLGTQYPTPNSTEGGRHLRWLYDQWDVQQSVFADNSIYDVIFLDRAGLSSVHPKDGTPVPANSKLMRRNGLYYFRNATSGSTHWDYDNSVVYRFSAPPRFRLGHPHLNPGSLMIRYKDDVLLQSPGSWYDEFGGDHHANAYQRGWLQSLTPLIHDPSQVYQRYSQVIEPDGGPHFKKYNRSGVLKSDPETTAFMLGEAGGEAWRMCEDMADPIETSDYIYLRADIKKAYKKYHTDSDRCPVCEVKLLIIKPTVANGQITGVIWYGRIKKADPSWKVQIPFHNYGGWTTTAYGFTGLGYRTTAGNGSPGKLWVDVRGIGNYTLLNNTPGTPLDANGYGPNQFKIAGTGINKPPGAATPGRQTADVKRHSMYVERTSKIEEEHYVFFMTQTAAAASEPASSRAWLSDGAQPDYYGITIGSTTYLLHRTQNLAATGSPDSTAPANATGMTLTPKDKAILTRWTDPADSDLKEVLVQIRTSAI